MLTVTPVNRAYYYLGEQFMGRMPNGKYEPCDGSVDYKEIFEEELSKLQRDNKEDNK